MSVVGSLPYGVFRWQAMQRVKTVIHVHTNYSYDSNLAPREVVRMAEAEGVDCVAITDHDEMRGAWEARDVGGVRVVIGQEISTADGHLIGLFLNSPVPRGFPASETARRIRDQGGLVLAPHAFATLCDSSLGRAVHRLAGLVDAVEVFNAQNPLAWEDWRAARFARSAALPRYVGADVHLTGRLAYASQDMDDFDSPAEFVEGLKTAKFHTNRVGLGYLARMAVRHLSDKIIGRGLPGFGINSPLRMAQHADSAAPDLQVRRCAMGESDLVRFQK